MPPEGRVDLAEAFRRRFGRRARGIARAPGRVNLIGEHTDYNGLPVLPFAIDRAIRIAFAPREDRRIRIANASPAFGPRDFEIRFPIPPSPPGDWANYVKAAVEGLRDRWPESQWRGFDALVAGDIPPGAGLSSSTALVVASALTACAANEIPWEPLPLAERLARAERYVGTEGGGMDHAASLAGRAGHVLRIDFFPLRVEAVPAPPFEIVVARSLVPARKTAEARGAYNLRVAECRLAAALVARATGWADAGPPAPRIGDLVARAPSQEALEAAAEEALAADALGIDDVARGLGIGSEEVVRGHLTRPDGKVLADPAGRFRLRRRFLYVVREARRVEASCEALRAADLAALGAILREGHASLRDLYEVSCPEVDALCRLGREAGALGSRLTGAGFGGSTIHLLAPGEEAGFRARLDEVFYGGARGVPDRSFAVRPAEGAGVEVGGGSADLP